MHSRQPLACVFSLFISLSAGPATRAASLTLNTANLPSLQNWIYGTDGVHSGEMETSIWSANAGGLGMDTMESPMGQAGDYGTNNYSLTLAGWDYSFSMSFRMRVLASEGSGYGFTMAARATPGTSAVASFGSGIVLFGGSTLPVSTGEFHDYRMEFLFNPRFPSWNQEYSLYVDGLLVDSVYATSSSSDLPNRSVQFGDFSGTANAEVEITSLTVTYQIPEPRTTSALAMSALALNMRRRRDLGKGSSTKTEA